MRTRVVLAALVAILLVGLGISLSVGAVTLDLGEVWTAVARRLGMSIGDEPARRVDSVVWNIRLPRTLLGMVAGGGLGVAGVVLQGSLRNPLADPHLLGIGPGAAIGAALGALAGGVQGAIAGGVATGILTALVVRRLSRGVTTLDPTRFVLSGVALGAALSAIVGFIVFVSDQSRIPPIEFWLLGSLTGSTWRALGTAAAIGGGASLALLGAGRVLDLLTLGIAEARHLGVDVELATTVLLMGVGITTGAGVGAVGVISFVGLIAPHIARRLIGPRHGPLLVASLLTGAITVVFADIGARTLAKPSEIPVGLLTAAVGGSFFLWLISRRKVVT